MFSSSSKHTYLLHHQEPPPNSGASTSMVNEIFLQDMLSGHYPVSADPVLFNHDLLGPSPNGDPQSMAHMCKSAKKDRHSKIHTAQGPRDRRVRLSIGVARKFFDLQEMLGFDKPSKTLDWLLTKSKSAIRHLVHTKHPPGTHLIIEEINNHINNNDNGFVDDDGEEDDDVHSNNKKKGKSSAAAAAATNKKSKGGGGGGVGSQQHSAARESRVKARARARERTREKMCIKQQMCGGIGEYDQMVGPAPVQYMNNQLEVCRISAGGGGGILHYDQIVNDDLIQESNVINKRNKQVKHNHHNPSIFGFQPVVGYNNINGPDNWDITNFSSQSSLCAILDQHKFNIHNSSNN